jgi:hypothetical protein
MKKLALAALLFAAAVGLAWLAFTFTLVRTVAGDELLILRPEQARECAEGGPCAVFSEREFGRAIREMCRRPDRL